MLELAALHQLTTEASARLTALGQFGTEPQLLKRTVACGVAIAGAALGGLGIIFWVAANWNSLTRGECFTLLQAVIVVMCAGALLRAGARLPLSILAFLAIGALFAYFGQTYQSGADAWQLFALWAALALPLCLGVRHDALWAPWALVAMTGLSLWMRPHSADFWRVNPDDLMRHLAGWSMALLLTFAFSSAFSRYTGAGVATTRVALVLTTVMLTMTAMLGLFGSNVAPQYLLGLLMLAVVATAFSQPRFFDPFALSSVGLGLNVLLIAGMARLFLHAQSSDPLILLLLFGMVAAGFLAGTVNLIIRLTQRQAESRAQA